MGVVIRVVVVVIRVCMYRCETCLDCVFVHFSVLGCMCVCSA